MTALATLFMLIVLNGHIINQVEIVKGLDWEACLRAGDARSHAAPNPLIHYHPGWADELLLEIYWECRRP